MIKSRRKKKRSQLKGDARWMRDVDFQADVTNVQNALRTQALIVDELEAVMAEIAQSMDTEEAKEAREYSEGMLNSFTGRLIQKFQPNPKTERGRKYAAELFSEFNQRMEAKINGS